ncbi:hypothetical protein ACOSP7_012495 [Xanthoceras sorbifolium]
MWLLEGYPFEHRSLGVEPKMGRFDCFLFWEDMQDFEVCEEGNLFLQHLLLLLFGSGKQQQKTKTKKQLLLLFPAG